MLIIVAKLAQVAYFQDPKYVGKNLAVVPAQKKALASLNRPLYSTNQKEQVLGVSTDNKFPEVTAEDLGITSKDLSPDTRQINNVQSALVTPGSILYNIKKGLEGAQLKLSFSNNQKTKSYMIQAKNRLSEIKTLLSKGDLKDTDQLLSQAVDDIKKATNLAKNDPHKDVLLVEIKKTYDLYYAVMGDKANNVPEDQKAQFVDSVYNFYQKGKAEISPVINASVIVNPTQQKPTVGVIEKVSSTEMTLKFDDGSTKQVNMSDGTNVRSSDQEVSQDLNNLKIGTKVAVLGPTGEGNTINAQFVLNNIPQGLTDQHQGTVTSVDPNQRVIKVIDQKGQVNIVKIDDSTSVKSKDTNVSIEGIKAGSQVIIFGATSANVSTDSATSSGNTGDAPVTPKHSVPVSPSPVSTNKPSVVGPTPVPAPSPVSVIKATSVTVVVNSSGKTEVKQTPSPTPAAPTQEPAKATTAPAVPAATTKTSTDDKKDTKK